MRRGPQAVQLTPSTPAKRTPGDSLGDAVERVGEASLGIVETQLSLARLELARSARDLAAGAGWSVLAILLATIGWIAALAAAVQGLERWVDRAVALGVIGSLNLLLAFAAQRAARRRARGVTEDLEP